MNQQVRSSTQSKVHCELGHNADLPSGVHGLQRGLLQSSRRSMNLLNTHDNAFITISRNTLGMIPLFTEAISKTQGTNIPRSKLLGLHFWKYLIYFMFGFFRNRLRTFVPSRTDVQEGQVCRAPVNCQSLCMLVPAANQSSNVSNWTGSFYRFGLCIKRSCLNITYKTENATCE